MLRDGAGWAVKQGMGEHRDLDYLEEGGCLETAEPDLVARCVAAMRRAASRFTPCSHRRG